ncbi:histidine kinase [Actinomycetes bacterium KLBMP 9797]
MRWRTLTPSGRDALVAAILAAVLSVGILLIAMLVNARQPVPTPIPLRLAVGTTVMTIAGCATIAVRRRWPRAALAAATTLVLGCVALEVRSVGPAIGLVVCAYTVATRFPWRTGGPAFVGLAIAHAAGGIVLTRFGGAVDDLPTFWGVPGQDLDGMITATIASYFLPAALGYVVRGRRAHTAELIARAERLEAERELRDRAAAEEERGRIARELHDIAAHDLSAIVVQAGAADRLIDAEPARAKALLRDIRGQGRETLAALRQLVGVLRDDDTGGRTPQPSLARVGDLVAVARAAGVTVDVVTEGEPATLGALADLTAFRVIQEALTNARNHAPGAAVSVRIVHHGGVSIVVVNELRGISTSAGGHGLAGMRERVRQAGGTLRVGPTRDGRWEVVAHLPACAA